MPETSWPPNRPRRPLEGREILDRFKREARNYDFGWIPTAAVLAVIAIVLWSSWFTVQPEETAVIQRFGRVVRTAGPGLHFKWPAGIETATFVPTARVLKEEFGFRSVTVPSLTRTEYVNSSQYRDESLMLTGDLNVIDVQWIVQYRIDNPIYYLFRVRNPRQTIRDISEAIMRRVVGNRLGSDVLTVGRVKIAETVKEEMQSILDNYETGVRLVTVELQDVTPPDPVKPAFNEVNEARQDKERTINQAQERANREIPKARGEATKRVTEAEGYAVERVNRSRGEAARFEAVLSEYQRAPEVTRQRLYLEAMGSLLPEAKALYVVDGDQKTLVPLLQMETASIKTGGKE